MASKRRRLISDSKSDDEVDENIFLPDPDNSGDEDDSGDSESEFLDDISPEKTYSQASKNYRENQSKLEEKYVFEWVEGEKCYPCNVENTCRMSDNVKQKHKKMSNVELFKTFFSDDMNNYIIEATKLNGYDITMVDLNTFIGILIASAFNPRKSYKHYWSTDPCLSFEPIKKAMPRNKFQKIKSKIKYSKPEDKDLNDRAWRVRKLINLFRKNIQQFGYFQAAMAVDEMMAKFFGRTILKQFIKGKPIRFGLKFWGLSTPDGYLLDLDLYCGKNSAVGENKLPKCSLGSRVVLSLLQRFFSSVGVKKIPFYHLYMDNLFTSFDLFLHLQKLGLRCTGTIRENRVKNKNVIPKNSPRGTFAVKHEKTSGMNYITLVDSKQVSMVSTAAGESPLFVAKRRSKEKKEKVNVNFPNAFQLYNKFMGGVDVHDGRCNYVAPCIRSKKWTWTVFIRLIQSAIANAIVISNYVHKDEQKSTALHCIMAIAKHYLQQPESPQNKNHEVIRDKKMKNCSFCSKRTYLLCTTCKKYISKTCTSKNDH